MERSDKHSPRLDDQAAHETEGMIRAGRSTHADDALDPEPSGEGQPDVDRAPDGTLTGGTPPGMSETDVADRAELARFLGKEVWPAQRGSLLRLAQEQNAPDAVLDQLRSLPDRSFENVNDVWTELGHQVESRRT